MYFRQFLRAKRLINQVDSHRFALRMSTATESPLSKRPKEDHVINGTNGINGTSKPILKVAKLTENAFIPTRGSKQAAGYDLYSAYNCVIPSRGKILAKTDIQIALPDGCYGRVAPRSGLAHKHFIDVGAGVIDQDYRGNVGVIMFNFGEEEFAVKKGDRIAQLILERIFTPEIEEFPTLEETERGANGYGSTGK